ncbi:hypothetical protein Q8F55_003937 [Vanrija albida]|uniref:Uncharacterized protein n=1 Tax=Vanrija albida TaxID=181172 RepID=A0ABR3Q6D9_9TREE
MLEVERYTKEVIESDGQVHTRSYYSRPGDKKDSQKENQPEEENKQQEENERQDEEANDKDEDMQDPQQPGGTEDEMDLDNDSRLITGLDATASDESDDEDDFGSVTSGRSDFKSRVEKIIDLQKASEIKRRGAPPDLERVIQSLAGTLVRRKSCLNELFDLSNETISQLRTCLEQDVKVFAESDHTHTLEALRKTETANQDLLEQLAAMSADVDYFRSRLEEAEKANGALQAENNRLKES